MEQDSTKQTILQTAERLFAYKGYDAVGVQEIVTDAGITKPTLYYYFRSKRGLLEALVSTKVRNLQIQLRRLPRTTAIFSIRYPAL